MLRCNYSQNTRLNNTKQDMNKREIKKLKKQLPKRYSSEVVKTAKDRVTKDQVKNFFNEKAVEDSAKEIIVKSSLMVIKRYKKQAERLSKMAAAI